MSIDEQVPAFLAVSEAFFRAAGSASPARSSWLAAGPLGSVPLPRGGLCADDAGRAGCAQSDEALATQRA
jgi:hypothetical protein